MSKDPRIQIKSKSSLYRSVAMKRFALFASLLSYSLMAWTPGPIGNADHWLSIISDSTLLNSPIGLAASGDFSHTTPAVQGRREGLSGFRTVILSPRLGTTVYEVRTVAELNTAIQQLRNSRQSGKVLLHPGTYDFIIPPIDTAPALNLSNLSDVVIEAAIAGQRPLLKFYNPKASGIYVKNSKRLRISNLDIDYQYPESFGRIAYHAKALGGQTIEVVQSGGFQRADQVADFFSFNRNTGDYFNSVTPKRLHARILTTPPIYDFVNGRITHPALARFDAVNEPLVAMHAREGYGCAIQVTGFDAEDITISGLHIYSYPQMGIRVEAIKRGAWIKDNVIEPRPGASPFVSGRADGIHVSGANDTVVERNVTQNMGDDCLNIRGSDLPVMDVAITKNANGEINSSASSLTVEKNQGPDIAATGEYLALLSNTHRPLHVLRVISSGEGQKILNQLDWGTCNSQCVDNLLAQLTPRSSDGRKGMLYNLSRSGSRYLVQNNVCQHNAGRGMLIQAPNGRVRRNEINSPAGACILAVAENAAFTAGPGPSNVGIFSNTLNDCTRQDMARGPMAELERNAAIGITTPSHNEAFPLIQRLLIRLNTIQNIPRSGIGAARASHIEVTDNTFESVATIPETPLFRVAPSASVFIKNNTIR